MPHRVFKFHFTADLHSEEGRKIAAVVQAPLRSGEIDNFWKDTVGRGQVGTIWTFVDRVTDNREWSVSAMSIEEYDREAAAALREDVLAALQQHAQEFKELESELYDPG